MQQIVVNCFVSRTQLADPSMIVAGRVTKESCKYMTELFQTSKRVSIGSSDVVDLAFVFKETAIEAGGMMLDTSQGVSNAYVIRYKDDGELIPANECLAFPSDYQAFDVTHDFCYSHHIWSYLVRVNAEISRILGSASKSQSVSNRKRVKMGMDRMCWRYLVEKAAEVGCRGLQSVSLLTFKAINQNSPVSYLHSVSVVLVGARKYCFYFYRASRVPSHQKLRHTTMATNYVPEASAMLHVNANPQATTAPPHSNTPGDHRTRKRQKRIIYAESERREYNTNTAAATAAASFQTEAHATTPLPPPLQKEVCEPVFDRCDNGVGLRLIDVCALKKGLEHLCCR
eukprot:scaffold127501_cov28-Attheya_sp.AAC.1